MRTISSTEGTSSTRRPSISFDLIRPSLIASPIFVKPSPVASAACLIVHVTRSENCTAVLPCLDTFKSLGRQLAVSGHEPQRTTWEFFRQREQISQNGRQSGAGTATKKSMVAESPRNHRATIMKPEMRNHDETGLKPRATMPQLRSQPSAQPPQPSPLRGWCGCGDVVSVDRLIQKEQRRHGQQQHVAIECMSLTDRSGVRARGWIDLAFTNIIVTVDFQFSDSQAWC